MATEKRLIDLLRVDLCEVDISNCTDVEDILSEIITYLYEQPEVDAVEVVHGKWVDYCVRDWRCSECGEKILKVRNVDGYCYDDKPNYCPNCGAKMDGGIPMADCKVCGAWFSSTTKTELCPTCERALKRLNGYAVPVMRCKGCKMYQMDNGELWRCTNWNGLFRACKPDDFCSYGERRTDD